MAQTESRRELSFEEANPSYYVYAYPTDFPKEKILEWLSGESQTEFTSQLVLTPEMIDRVNSVLKDKFDFKNPLFEDKVTTEDKEKYRTDYRTTIKGTENIILTVIGDRPRNIDGEVFLTTFSYKALKEYKKTHTLQIPIRL